MFVDLSANWCPYCRQMDKNVLQDSKVTEFLGQFVTVRLDYDSEFGQSLKRRYGISGVPCIMLFDSTGELKGKLDGAPRSSADFIQYVTRFSQSDGQQFHQSSTAGGQAPLTAQPAWLQPQVRNPNSFSNMQAVPFPAAQMSGQAPLPVVPSSEGAWAQPQQNSWTGLRQTQYPAQQYSGNQPTQYSAPQYPGAQTPTRYPAQQYPAQQFAGTQTQYPGAQIPTQYYPQPNFSTQPLGTPPPGTPLWLQRAPSPNYPPQQTWQQQR